MKLVFFDIDGTLANGLDVPLSAQRAIEKLRNNGGKVFICTGRPVFYVKQHFSQYADGYICFNGRYGEMEGRVLHDCPLTTEQVRSLVSQLRELGAGFNFYNNDTQFTEDYFDGKDEYEKLYNFNIFFNSPEHFEQIREAMKDTCIFNPHGKAPHADTTVLGSDKGDAIRAVARALEVDLNDVYAFGDGANDVCMLKAAGHSIAMGNALEEAKQAAEYITSAIDDDGVEKALIHYGLI